MIVTKHSLPNFPFIREDRQDRLLNQPIMKFKRMSNFRYLNWLREVKHDQFLIVLNRTENEEP